jgi:hypothetical protein
MIAWAHRLWTMAFVCFLATITTIDLPPHVAWNLPLPGRVVLAVAALAMAIAAVVVFQRSKRHDEAASPLWNQGCARPIHAGHLLEIRR